MRLSLVMALEREGETWGGEREKEGETARERWRERKNGRV